MDLGSELKHERKMQLGLRDTTAIDTDRTAKQLELKAAEHNYFIVAQEILVLQRDIINLQAKKKDLEITASKANHVVKILRIEVKSLENEYWNAKNI